MEDLRLIKELNISHVERAVVYNILNTNYKFVAGVTGDAISLPKLDTTWYAKFVSGRGLSGIKTSSVRLSASEEVDLFSYYNRLKSEIEISKSDFLREDSDESSRHFAAIELLRLQKEIDLVKSTIVDYNLALLVNLVVKWSGSNLDFETLISESNTKLLECIEGFDVSKGNKFSTYVTTSLTRHWKKMIEKKASEDVVALGDDYDVIATEENSEVAFMREIISSNLAGLDETELKVLELRYLEGFVRTIEEVGKLMGISKGRISQVEKSARAKLLEAMSLDRKPFLGPKRGRNPSLFFC